MFSWKNKGTFAIFILVAGFIFLGLIMSLFEIDFRNIEALFSLFLFVFALSTWLLDRQFKGDKSKIKIERERNTHDLLRESYTFLRKKKLTTLLPALAIGSIAVVVEQPFALSHFQDAKDQARASLSHSPTLELEDSRDQLVSDSFADEADKGFYVTAGIGSGDLGDSFATTSLGIAGTAEIGSGKNTEFGFGYDFGNDIRTELTYSTISADLERFGAFIPVPGAVGTTLKSLNINVFKDFSNDTKFTPYIGAGLSSTTFEVDQIGAIVAAGTSHSMGYNLKLGSSYEVSQTTEVFVEGTYTNISGCTISAVNYSGVSILGAFAGIRFRV